MVSQEAVALYARACELFILDLTKRALSHSDANRRKTILQSDIAASVLESGKFDFLIDIVPLHNNNNNTE